MSDENNDDDKSSVFDETDDRVGYGKPPRKHRFAKGRSGNKNGRPKGARNKPPKPQRIDEILLAEGQRLIEVMTDGSKRMMPTVQAVARLIYVNSIKGDPRAQRLAVDMVSGAEARRDEQKRRNFQAAVDHIDIARRLIAEARRKGLPRPYFKVDPDDIQLDPENMEATYNGRSLEDDKLLTAFINYRAATRDDLIEGIKYILEQNPGIYDAGLLHTALTLKKVEEAMGPPFVYIGDDPYNFDAILARKKKDKGG